MPVLGSAMTTEKVALTPCSGCRTSAARKGKTMRSKGNRRRCMPHVSGVVGEGNAKPGPLLGSDDGLVSGLEGLELFLCRSGGFLQSGKLGTDGIGGGLANAVFLLGLLEGGLG